MWNRYLVESLSLSDASAALVSTVHQQVDCCLFSVERNSALLIPASNGQQRCWWPGDDSEYQRYHDLEWGRAVTNDVTLFEKICLEGFQSGLSWITILRKRENFRAAFANFDHHRIAEFTDDDVSRLMADAGIVRHRGKIDAVINNAHRLIELEQENTTFANYIWSFVPRDDANRQSISDTSAPIPSTSPESIALSRDLKKRGWKFVGPTTMYSMMQSMGLVNDHIEGCFVREECEGLRQHAIQLFSREEK
ncbi:MAG: hypothetical protein RIR69_277 [Actinomycetota bacterium]